MLAHRALCRLGESKPSARHLPQLARFLQRTLLARNSSSLPAVRALSRAYASALEARRSYATTKSATKPTATVTKAVKAKAAAKPAPAKRATRATKTAAAKTVKKKTATKAAGRAKPTAKKAVKKTPKKAAPKKPVRKVLTAEQKEKAKAKQDKAKLSELRRTALREPVSHHALTAYVAYIGENTRGKGELPAAKSQKLVESSQKWKTLTPAEHEHYNHLATEKTAAKRAEYRAWVLSHTAQEIHLANNARSQLRRLLKNTTKRTHPLHTSKIIDEREVKQPTNAYAAFVRARHATGDLKNIPLPEGAKLLSEEWKALSAGEKKKYEDEYVVDKARHARETAAAVAA
ncbi:hypothetical protein CC86DRAFT_399713 [Ophiobolus disseminans]|uniref:HMG box domain-containing protein n=1 Tax=Ophiobolus disseminans TaxID=1469910 RepID=A0A6A7AIX5_9PLEO|nr:hypothetical protein CC86DRAFT_399713 [Ophiobolus disseminans]